MKDRYLRFLKERPTLSQLREEFPEVYRETVEELATQSPDSAKVLLASVVDTARLHQRRIGQSQMNTKVIEASFPKLVKARILLLILQNENLRARTGVSGKVAFNRFNGTVLQWLFFEGPGFVRKPVSELAYSLVWPWLRQRSFLMPLVNKKGIYCFYSRRLVRSLAKLLKGHRAIEVAAGDGTLTRFLRQSGVTISASDDKSWSEFIDYPEEVETLGVQDALRTKAPTAVVCSWPPLDNSFEKAIFDQPSVELYVVIGGPECGNRATWDQQTRFDRVDDEALSRGVLPRGQNHVVSVFRLRR